MIPRPKTGKISVHESILPCTCLPPRLQPDDTQNVVLILGIAPTMKRQTWPIRRNSRPGGHSSSVNGYAECGTGPPRLAWGTQSYGQDDHYAAMPGPRCQFGWWPQSPTPNNPSKNRTISISTCNTQSRNTISISVCDYACLGICKTRPHHCVLDGRRYTHRQ